MNADLVTGMFGEWGVDAPDNYVVAVDAHSCDHIKEHMPEDVYDNIFADTPCKDMYDANPATKAAADAYAAAIESGADHATAFDAASAAIVAYVNASNA